MELVLGVITTGVVVLMIFLGVDSVSVVAATELLPTVLDPDTHVDITFGGLDKWICILLPVLSLNTVDF